MHRRIAGTAAVMAVVLIVTVGIVLMKGSGWTFASNLEVIGDDLGLTVTPASTPLFTERNMAPGDKSSARLTVINEGQHDFSFTLSAEKESGDDSIYDALWIDVTGKDSTEYYSGSLGGLSEVDITRLGQGEDEELTLTVTFNQSAGNPLQGLRRRLNLSLPPNSRRYTIVAEPRPPEGGTVTGSGVYEHGDLVTLDAEANDGYAFVYYLEGANLYSILESEYRFTALNDRTLFAEFWEAGPTTLFARVDLNENGYGVVDFGGVKLEFLGGPPNISGVVSFTPCDRSGDGAPKGRVPTGLYFCFRRSDNLAGTRVRLELSYEKALPLPEGVEETSLELYRWNEVLRRWDKLYIADQGVSAQDNILWADVDNFSVFGIFYPGRESCRGRVPIYWLIFLALVVLAADGSCCADASKGKNNSD